MPNEENPQGFVRSKLPWIAAGGALVIFLLTLNQWVNLRSLPVVSRITGWDWTLPTQAPLLQALTFPIRYLPAGIQPVALNVFAALCAALTLGLLARSVALLPHDRTHEQRTRERSEFSLLSIRLAWLPPLLAVLVCGLQLTFWEHATALTGESLDLLLFAYVVRCLLEYRVSRKEAWLSKLALVYGLGATNNWALIGFFPLCLMALIWIKGVRFFDPGFLARMTALGLGGLLLYLLLPIVWMVKGSEGFSFIQVLKANWVSQKLFLVDITPLRNRALLLGLVSILPVILMGIRWPSSFGDTSAAGEKLTNAAFRIIHLFFLAACIYVAFDPGYSPRQLGMGLPFLTFYYLAALAIGYYAGYALLVFTESPRKSSWKRENPLDKVLGPVVRVALLAALVGVPAGLVYKNFALVKASDGKLLREFAAQTAVSIPNEPAYLMSEDPFQLALVEATLETGRAKTNYVFVNTRALETPGYHLQMQKRYGNRWPALVDPADMTARVDQFDIQQMVRGLASSNRVIYLHPSFGYFFDVVYAVPHGQTFALQPFQPSEVLPPALESSLLQQNSDYWQKLGDFLDQVERMRKLDAPDALYLTKHYSRSVNAWGVNLQRSQKLTEAGKEFTEAVALNTNNISALFNNDFNQAYQKGNHGWIMDFSKADALLGAYQSWDELLAENGPLDHPDFCVYLGTTFLTSGQYRQAALQYSRTVTFQPTNFQARVGFSKALVFGGWPERGLAELQTVQSDFKNLPPINQAELVAVEAAAYYGMTNFAKAEKTLLDARAARPEIALFNESLLELYRSSGRITNALALLEQQIDKNATNVVARMQKAELLLSREDFEKAHATLDSVLAISPGNPAALLFHAFGYIQQKRFDEALIRIDKVLQADMDNVQALIYKGVVNMEKEQHDKARQAFNAALLKEPRNVSALRNRAVLNLRAERWSEAKDDYEALRRLAPKSHAVFYGLGEVAYHQKEYEAAERYYRSYLKYAPAAGVSELADEKKKVESRLQEIKLATR